MRLNLKRIFLLSFTAFCTTLVILSLPRNSFENALQDWTGSRENAGRQMTNEESRLLASPQRRQDQQIGEPKRVRPVRYQKTADNDDQRPEVPPAWDEFNIHAPKLKGLGDQLAFQKQPNPPSLIKREKENLDFEVNASRMTITKIEERIKNVDLEELIAHQCRTNTTLSAYWHSRNEKDVPRGDNWEKFYSEIGSCAVYNDEEMIASLLRDLNRMPIKHVSIMDGGTQVKMVLTFENDKQAVMKPMRFGRDYEADPNHFYFSDFERHNAEIATYHLDKILGYRRAIPTVGRIFNMTSELYEKAEKKLKKTFFVSPAKNQCFVSRCDYYCDTTHAICGLPDLKEGSVQVFLPDESAVPRKHNRSPYRRTYSKRNQVAEWQADMNYCNEKVKTKKMYAHGRRLLDLVDLHIMDYMIGNQDRHHYETFQVFEDIPAYALHIDNGRAFGRTDFDDEDIILPLRQCCVIRASTLKTLLQYGRRPRSLSMALYKSMNNDPVAPVLATKHYPALERRLNKILQYLVECLEAHPASKVVLNEFHNPNIEETDFEHEEEETEESEDDDPPPQPAQKPDHPQEQHKSVGGGHNAVHKKRR